MHAGKVLGTCRLVWKVKRCVLWKPSKDEWHAFLREFGSAFEADYPYLKPVDGRPGLMLNTSTRVTKPVMQWSFEAEMVASGLPAPRALPGGHGIYATSALVLQHPLSKRLLQADLDMLIPLGGGDTHYNSTRNHARVVEIFQWLYNGHCYPEGYRYVLKLPSLGGSKRSAASDEGGLSDLLRDDVAIFTGEGAKRLRTGGPSPVAEADGKIIEPEAEALPDVIARIEDVWAETAKFMANLEEAPSEPTFVDSVDVVEMGCQAAAAMYSSSYDPSVRAAMMEKLRLGETWCYPSCIVCQAPSQTLIPIFANTLTLCPHCAPDFFNK